MTTKEHLTGQWREWRYAHVADMFRPYGWTSLVAQDWLREGERDVVLDLLPGTWSVENGAVMYTPGVDDTGLSVDGEYPAGPVEIVPGRNQTYGHGQSAPVYAGELEVETIIRTTDAGSPLFAVRVRDPRQTALASDAGVTAFAYDPAWRLPGTFAPFERIDHEAETVETGVRELTPYIGTFTFTHEGTEHEVVLLGKDTATGVQPVVHFRDQTSGPVTYGAGRVVELQFTDETESQIEWIDFNYAVALPCAFTNFVTCPLPPQQNRFDFEVLAGEKRPARDIVRVLTFHDA